MARLLGTVDELHHSSEPSFIRRDDTGLPFPFIYTGVPVLAVGMRVSFEVANGLAISVMPALAAAVAAFEEAVAVPALAKAAVPKRNAAINQPVFDRMKSDGVSQKRVAKKTVKKVIKTFLGTVDEMHDSSEPSFIRRDDTGLPFPFIYTGDPVLAKEMRVTFKIANGLAISVKPVPAAAVAAIKKGVAPAQVKAATRKKGTARRQPVSDRVNAAKKQSKKASKKAVKKN